MLPYDHPVRKREPLTWKIRTPSAAVYLVAIAAQEQVGGAPQAQNNKAISQQEGAGLQSNGLGERPWLALAIQTFPSVASGFRKSLANR